MLSDVLQQPQHQILSTIVLTKSHFSTHHQQRAVRGRATKHRPSPLFQLCNTDIGADSSQTIAVVLLPDAPLCPLTK
jgi:hypothetical protein